MSGLRQYISSLLMYPISLERAFEKFDNMISSLDALDTQNGNVVCNYQDLGQVILRKKYKFPYLYKYIWKDEAKRSWTFSYIQDGKGNAYVYLMKYSAFITKENNEHNTNTMNNTKKRIILTESQLHRIIKEAINGLDWKTLKNAERKSRARGGYEDIERADRFKAASNKAFVRDHYPSSADKGFLHHASVCKPDGYTPDYPILMPDTLGYRGKDNVAMNKARKEVEDYIAGNYEYNDEMGWHLKDNLEESIRRAIRKVLC